MGVAIGGVITNTVQDRGARCRGSVVPPLPRALSPTAMDALVADTLSLIAPPYFDRAIWKEMLRSRMGERGASSKCQPAFSAELCALLHGVQPRASGDPVPDASSGMYERIAPSAAWDRLGAGRARINFVPGARQPKGKPRFEVPPPALRRQGHGR